MVFLCPNEDAGRLDNNTGRPDTGPTMGIQVDTQAAYLPGGETPDIQALGQLPYGRETFASIARGDDPSLLGTVELSLGCWALLFIHKGVPGIYAPASESAMAALMRGPLGDRPEPILLRFTPESLVQVSLEAGRTKDPAGLCGALIRFLGFGGKDRYVISWKGKGDKQMTLDFFPLAKNAEFSKAFRDLAWYREPWA